jgi:hypothetical protein
MSNSKGVSTAVPLADSLFDQARQVAKSGTPTRVVIYADYSATNNEENRSRYLRMMGVATGRDSSGDAVSDIANVQQWRLVSRAITIPSNTFFNANLSNKTSTTGTAVFPGSNDGKDCYVYQFNSEGALIDATGTPVTNGQFVVQAGKLRPGQDTPSIDNNSKRDIGGFKIWANGRMAMFRSPNQIVSSTDDPTF